MPADDLKGLIAWLKANPDKASQGTGGVGTTSHIAGVFFQQTTGTRFTLVPYRGAGPAMQDLVAGQIDLMIDPASNTMPYVRAGTIKAYAVTAKSRMTTAPDVPTVDEAGLPGFHILNWTAYFAPKGTPQGDRRPAQRRGRRRARRSGGARARRRSRAGDLSARHADARRARRVPQGRDREMVADHQGGRNQGAVVGARRGAAWGEATEHRDPTRSLCWGRNRGPGSAAHQFVRSDGATRSVETRVRRQPSPQGADVRAIGKRVLPSYALWRCDACRRANLPLPPDHHDRAVPARRGDRRHRAHHERPAAHGARPDRDHRERRRRRRLDRGRPRRARGARRLHAQSRPARLACDERRRL